LGFDREVSMGNVVALLNEFIDSLPKPGASDGSPRYCVENIRRSPNLECARKALRIGCLHPAQELFRHKPIDDDAVYPKFRFTFAVFFQLLRAMNSFVLYSGIR
jgi:hypothetical protein